MYMGALGTKVTMPVKPDPAAAACKQLPPMPPLEDLEMMLIKIPPTPQTHRMEEPASEKRAIRREHRERVEAIKKAALGIGPMPRGGMPQYGVDLWLVPDLARKAYLCGRDSLTAAEKAKGIELGNKKRGEIHRAARKRRLKKIKKVVAVVAIGTAAVFLGPAIMGKVGAGAGKAAAKTAVLSKGGAAAAGKAGAAVAAKAAAKAGITKLAPSTAAKAAAKSVATKAVQGAPKVLKSYEQIRQAADAAGVELPGLPTDLSGKAFRDWAGDLAKKELAKELQRELTPQESAEADQAVRDSQREMVQYARDETRAAAAGGDAWKIALAVGIPAAALLMG